MAGALLIPLSNKPRDYEHITAVLHNSRLPYKRLQNPPLEAEPQVSLSHARMSNTQAVAGEHGQKITREVKTGME